MTERIDAWGESQKAARKNLPLKRAYIQRAYRHRVRTELARGEEAEPAAIRRKPFKKWAGSTRQDRLDQQRELRQQLQDAPRKGVKARERRKARRSGSASRQPR